MITDGVAEILIGLIVDPQFGQVLVLGAGGVFTEMLSDSVTLLPPWTRDSVESALQAPRPSRSCSADTAASRRGDIGGADRAVLGVPRYAAANVAALYEIDVNPVIVRPAGKGAVAVDAMIRLRKLA